MRAISASSTWARTGRYQQRSSANASHFTASFSVINTARAPANATSAAVNRWWSGKGVARPRDRCAAEVERVVPTVERDLDDVRIERFRFVFDRMTRRCDRGVGMGSEKLRHRANQTGRKQRLVALDVHDDGIVGKPEALRGLGKPIGARRMVNACETCRDAVRLDGSLDPIVIGRHDDAIRARLLRTQRNEHHHRLPGNFGERLPWEPRRRVARGNDDGEGGHEFAGARPPRLLVLALLEAPRFVFEHHGNAVPDGVREPRRFRDELLLVLVVDERALGDRADEDFKELWVHGSVSRSAQRAHRRPGRGLADTSSARRRRTRILPRPSRSSKPREPRRRQDRAQ